MRVIDFWVQTTLEGYVDEFTIEIYQSFSKANVMFWTELRGKLHKEIPLWIKVLMVEEGLIPFQGLSMVV